MLRRIFCLLTTLLSLGCIGFVFAVPAPQTLVIGLSGMVLEPAPCTISGLNGQATITVDFGLVKITALDGEYYKRPIDYKVECSAPTSNAMQLRFAGQSADASLTCEGCLATDIPALGIKISSDTQSIIRVGVDTVKFTYPGTPKLYAAPISISSSPITNTTKAFVGNATLEVIYQ